MESSGRNGDGPPKAQIAFPAREAKCASTSGSLHCGRSHLSLERRLPPAGVADRSDGQSHAIGTYTIEMPYFGGMAMLAGVAAAILISWRLPFLGRLATVQQILGLF